MYAKERWRGDEILKKSWFVGRSVLQSAEWFEVQTEGAFAKWAAGWGYDDGAL